MYKHIKEKWVAALRSGKYDQATGTLKIGNQYCCLGVLCDLATKENICKESSVPSAIYTYYDNEKQMLPKSVIQWANLGREAQIELIELNDTEEWSFTRIADWIEENL